MGMHMLLNFGVMEELRRGGQQVLMKLAQVLIIPVPDVFGRQKSTSTTGTTDNLTVEYKDKSIENLLEKIDCHIKRMKMGSSYGVWEVALDFISNEKKTAAIAANTYRSLLLGEETGIEKPNFTLFDSMDEKNGIIEETLTYCENPIFLVPSFDALYGKNSVQRLSPSSYINGKELALLLNSPKKIS